jgi:hypothetical protein
MLSSTNSAPCHNSRVGSSRAKNVCVYGVTETGCLHILHLGASGITLQHIIPSVHLVSMGVPLLLEMTLPSVMEVCAPRSACFL